MIKQVCALSGMSAVVLGYAGTLLSIGRSASWFWGCSGCVVAGLVLTLVSMVAMNV